MVDLSIVMLNYRRVTTIEKTGMISIVSWDNIGKTLGNTFSASTKSGYFGLTENRTQKKHGELTH
jgi:hypothetical protein